MNKKKQSMLPRVGITVGDPAGIGPEVVIKALAGENLYRICAPVVICDEDFFRAQAEALGLKNFKGIRFHDLKNLSEKITIGEESALTGKASFEYIEAAVSLWKKGKIDAVATAPISKTALKLAGIKFPGHTEMLADLTGTSEFAMSFFAGELRVVLLSTHLSLVDAIKFATRDNLARLILFSDRELSKLLRRQIKIAVAGLNPHASEGGMFGSEEADEIIPAIAECRAKGVDVSGPYSPDTIFLRGFRGEFDAIIACYHDQATIAVKSAAFSEAVNVTLGLPLIRTSVDHGTAFDIAGKGFADASSMKAAIWQAAKLSTVS